MANVCLFALTKNNPAPTNLIKLKELLDLWYCVSNYFEEILTNIQKSLPKNNITNLLVHYVGMPDVHEISTRIGKWAIFKAVMVSKKF